MSVQIITDSTSDLLLEEAYNMGVGVVPLKVIIGDEEYRD
ncbi:MAG: DegV family protein, partial [Clostridia bacterium]|nr:DegV family protein [Clostridia bacterium]